MPRKSTLPAKAFVLSILTFIITGAYGASFEVVYTYDDDDYLRTPPREIIQAANGDFYGTSGDDEEGAPAIFRLYKDGSNVYHTDWFTLPDRADGIMQANDGTIYITGRYTGIYKITNNVLSQFYAYGPGDAGNTASGPFLEASDGNFYGTTERADGPEDFGTIFRITPAGVRTTLHVFNGTSGACPLGGLIQGSDGSIYGTTYAGGSVTSGHENGLGTVFKIATNGTFTLLATFDGTNGCRPNARLVEAGDGNLYGITEQSFNGFGTIFKVTPSGTITKLHQFTGPDGTTPEHRLVLGTNGALYGATRTAFNVAMTTMFKITTGGSFTILHRIGGAPSLESSVNVSGLVLANDGYFYGTLPDRYLPALDTDTRAVIFRLLDEEDSDPPSISVQPVSQVKSVGSDLGLTVEGLGLQPLSYQWQKGGADLVNGGKISGATTGSLVITNLAAGDAGDYTVIITNAAGTVTSAVAAVTVTPIVITSQPSPQARPLGTAATFNVSASGLGTLTYQWRKGGEDLVNDSKISGATTKTLTIANITASDIGAYSAVVMNGSDSVISADAPLTIQDPGIVTNPRDSSSFYGQNVTLTVVASGTTTLSYQWKKNGTNLVDGGNISGAASSTLSIASGSYRDNGTYTVTVSNSVGVVTSTPAMVHVSEPSIASQPVSQTVLPGGVATFTVVPIGSSPFTYQWFKYNGIKLVDGGNISGATAASLTIASVSDADAGWYLVRITNPSGQILSRMASLTVPDPSASTSPTIWAQPASQSVSWGSQVLFSVVATGAAPLSYQWKKDGATLTNDGNISGATTPTLTVDAATFSDVGTYSVVLSNTAGVVQSSGAWLTLNTNLTVKAQPGNVTANRGDSATFSVEVEGPGPIYYQWVKGHITAGGHFAIFLYNGSKYAGVNGPDLTIKNLALGDATNYFVFVASRPSDLAYSPWYSGTALSAQATLTVVPTPVIIQQPVSKGVHVGSNVTVSVTADPPSAAYQWYKDDSPLAGKTGSSLTIVGAQLSDTGYYHVEVSNELGSVTSAPAFVQVSYWLAIYHGLFYETNEIRHTTSGFIQMKRIGTNFSGKIMLEGLSHGFAGKFTNGIATRTIIRTNVSRENLTMMLQSAAGDEEIIGTLSGTGWTAAIQADYSPFNLTNFATEFQGKYTMAIPGFADGSQGPPGYGCAALTVAPSSKVKYVGALADGQPLRMNVAQISGNGTWPFYSHLYPVRVTNEFGRVKTEFRGSAMGWLTFTNNAPVGTVSWIKTAWISSLYSAGFTNDSAVISSRYVYASSTPVLSMTNGLLTFSNGNLAAPFSANVLLKTNNALIALPPSTNKTTVGLSLANGLFRGSFRHPENTNVVTRFVGAILQQQNHGVGHFAGTNHAGLLILDAQ